MIHFKLSVLPLRTIFSSLIALGLVVGNIGMAAAKDVRKTMTAAQKSELRKKALEWCKKNYIQGGAFIVRVEILSDGRVRCWVKG